jgi:hypothetical protein
MTSWRAAGSSGRGRSAPPQVRQVAGHLLHVGGGRGLLDLGHGAAGGSKGGREKEPPGGRRLRVHGNQRPGSTPLGTAPGQTPRPREAAATPARPGQAVTALCLRYVRAAPAQQPAHLPPLASSRTASTTVAPRRASALAASKPMPESPPAGGSGSSAVVCSTASSAGRRRQRRALLHACAAAAPVTMHVLPAIDGIFSGDQRPVSSPIAAAGGRGRSKVMDVSTMLCRATAARETRRCRPIAIGGGHINVDQRARYAHMRPFCCVQACPAFGPFGCPAAVQLKRTAPLQSAAARVPPRPPVPIHAATTRPIDALRPPKSSARTEQAPHCARDP